MTALINPNYFPVFSLVVATLIEVASCGFYLGRRYVHVRNDLENRARMEIHCWSADYDLGRMTLNPNQETIWSFIDDYVWGTKFECNMKFRLEGGIRMGRFIVYDNKHKMRTRECYKRCKWSVRRYGIYAYDEKDRRWDYETPWPCKSSFLSFD